MLDGLSNCAVTEHFSYILFLRRIIALLLCQLGLDIFHLLLFLEFTWPKPTLKRSIAWI